MREIYYNSDITSDSINELKLLALYYDKINIINDAVYSPKFETINNEFKFIGTEEFQLIPEKFKEEYKLLLDEGLITIIDKKENHTSIIEDQFADKISKIVNSNHSLIFPKHPSKKDTNIITEEVYEVMKNMYDFELEKPVELNIVWWYYSLKLQQFITLLIEGKNCLSSSENLNSLFTLFISEFSTLNTVKKSSKSLAFDALKFSLPNPSSLSFENILELRLVLKDELGEFYQTINSIEIKNKNLFETNIEANEYQSIFYNEIQKPLKQLELKMKNLNSKTFRNFINKLQNPKSFVPLIGTVVASIPIQYGILCSLGINMGQSYLEYHEEKREITNNGLYFLLKIKNI